MRLPDNTDDAGLALRCETRSGTDGSAMAMIMLGFPGTREPCLVAAVTRDAYGVTWTERLGRVPMDCIRLPMADIVRAIPGQEARQGLLISIGVFPRGSDTTLASQVVSFWRRFQTQGRLDLERPLGNHRQSPVDALHGLGLMGHRKIVHVLDEAARAAVSRPRSTGHGATDPSPVRIHRAGEIAHREGLVRTQVTEWQDGLPAAFVAPDLPYVDPLLWSARFCRFYAVGGRVGEYRRQAAALYPFAAPAFDRHDGLRALVDAGRPFEDLLLEVLGGLVPEGKRGGLTLAKLRRMRGLRDEFRFYWLVEVLSVVSCLPLGRVPVGPDAWRWLFRDIEALSLQALDDATGLRLLATLPGPTPGGRLFRTGCLAELEDLVDRCASTLVSPMLACTPMVAKAVAGQLLLGGVGFGRACAISDRWHANLAAFDRELPRGEDRSTWPALFEPFETKGVRILCLTAPSMLRDEGLDAEDGEGVAGLSHCVGGYAPQAWAGECHLLSVRRRVGEGWVRLSTVEVTAHAIATGGIRVGLVQHQGPGNREPAYDAARALDELLVGLRTGSHPHDPAALAKRPVEDYDDGITWSSPEAVEATLSAWRPHLPRNARDLGPDGMRERLAALRAGVVAMGVAGAA